MLPKNMNKSFIIGTRKTGCDLLVLGGTNCKEWILDQVFGDLDNEKLYVCEPINLREKCQEIREVSPLYAFKVATAYFREQDMVPIFENSHCKLIKI